MSALTPALQQTLAENVWLHFFQMGHMSSTSARPTVLVRGEGSRVWDQDGNEYIDALAGLFAAYCDDPGLLPAEWRPVNSGPVAIRRAIGDFVAGMTDRYAIRRHEELVGPALLPEGF
jgi:hypothetical protein